MSDKSDLLKFYKRIVNCKKCGIEYGVDSKIDCGLCPSCIKNPLRDLRRKNGKK